MPLSFQLSAIVCDRFADKAGSPVAMGVNVFPESLMTPFELPDSDFAAAAQSLDGPFCTAVDAIAAKNGLWIVYTVNESASVCVSSIAKDPGSVSAFDEFAASDAATALGGDANSDGLVAWEGSAAPGIAASPETPSGLASPSNLAVPYNTAVVVDDAGCKRGMYRKTHLFDTDFVKESDKVAAGAELMAPILTPFCSLGVGICYDLRFPELARAAALAGCQVLVYPAAWVDGPRKVAQWRTLLAARAIENEMFVAGLSRCDREFGSARRDYAGHSCVFGPLGEEIATAEGASPELVVADIDVDAIAAARAAMPVLAHRRTDLYS